MMRLILGTAGAVVAATLGGMALAQIAPAPAAPPAFAACRACHTVTAGGRNGIGPNLHGVVGRPAATVAGFTYSPALKASKLRWDEKTLNDYLAAPAKKVPGTRMPIATPDAAKRAAIIAYLKTAK
jgi:cytochrome c